MKGITLGVFCKPSKTFACVKNNKIISQSESSTLKYSIYFSKESDYLDKLKNSKCHINGKKCVGVTIGIGVGQPSIGDPLLFLTYINNFPCALPCREYA